MNDTLGKFSRVLLLGSLLACPALIYAQADDEEPQFELSPFEVTSAGSIGYQARDTLAGTRLRTDLRDVANAVQVINQQFLQDTGATDAQSLLVYTTNTEVGGLHGNFSGVGDSPAVSDSDARARPQSNTRVRGLDSADNTRNFFLSSIPWDGYNVERVDIQRGANAVLFGIGSPAGIINTQLVQAQFFDSGKIEFRYGRYGSLRGNFDVNQQIIDDELAIRVAGLYDHTYYRQDPAYQRDRRIYGTLRWDPSFLRSDVINTSIVLSGESGRIRANRPRMLPPEDRITPWFNQLNRITVDPRLVNLSSLEQYEEMGRPSSYGLTSPTWTNTANNGEPNPNYSPWVNRFANVFGPVAVFEDVNSPDQNGILNVQGVDFYQPRPSLLPPAPSLPFNQWVGVTSYSDYGARADLPGSSIGAIKNRSLTDPEIFDFYRNLLDGPTKYEHDDFKTYNATLRQDFLQNLVGIEAVYDFQSHDREYSQTIADDGYAIAVDIQEYLYNSSTADSFSQPGVPNPNVGRPIVAARGQNGFRQERESETFRVTAFANIDFGRFIEDETWVARILGRHVFTGVYTKNEVDEHNFSWFHAGIGDGYPVFTSQNGPPFGDGQRQVGTVSYLGNDMRGLTNPAQARISRINATRIARSGTAQAFDWTVADTTVPRNPVNLARYVGYRDVNVPVLNALSGDLPRLYNPNGTTMNRMTTSSRVLVWQGFLFDDLIVPTVSWRQDEEVSRRSGASPIASRTDGVRDGGLIFDDPDWRVPLDENDVGANRAYNREGDQNVSWGVVVHAPTFLTSKLPGDLGLSVFYNDSSNFRPSAARVDVFGNSVPSPVGTTKDYGFTVSALQDRVVLKVNWYETVVQNATLTSLGGDINYMVGWSEAWGYSFARLAQLATEQGGNQTFDTNYALEDVTDPETGEVTTIDHLNGVFLAYQPAPGQTYEQALAAQRLATETITSSPPPKEFQEAWGFDIDAWEAGPKTSRLDPTGLTGDLTVLSENRSKGVEIELSTQITPNWNLTFNVARTEAVRDNIASNYVEWVEARYEYYQGPAGDVRYWNGSWSNAQTETLRAKFTREFYGPYMQQRQLEGSIIPENRRWRFNLVTNYTFTESVLRGINIGGSYRWQDRHVVGYPVLPDPVTGWVYDIANPIKGPTESNIDLWIGYTRPITDRVDWRIQLNVRNAFARDELIPVTTQPDGSPGIFRIHEGMSWFITNTITF